jgi:hypothetical protein
MERRMERLPRDVRKVRDVVLSVERIVDGTHLVGAPQEIYPKLAAPRNRHDRTTDKHIEKVTPRASRILTGGTHRSRGVQVGAVFLQRVPLRLSVAERIAVNIIIHACPQASGPGIGQTDIRCLLFRRQHGEWFGAADSRQRRGEDDE